MAITADYLYRNMRCPSLSIRLFAYGRSTHTVANSANIGLSASRGKGEGMRTKWVDIAKGIGIILVVYGHVLRGLHEAGIEMSEGFFKYSDTLVYGFHMPLFFFLSGMYAAKWAKRDLATATLQKTRTLLYPYLIWSLLQGVIMISLSSLTNNTEEGLTFTNLGYHIALAPYGQFWFLYTLFFLFMLYYLMKKVTNDSVIVLVSLALLMFVPEMIDAWAVGSLCSNFAYFALGSLLYQKGLIDKLLQFKGSLTISSLLFVGINAVYISALDSLNNFGLQAVSFAVALIGIMFTMNVSYRLANMQSSVLAVIGSASMTIYLVHILAGSGTRIVLSKLLHVDDVIVHLILGLLVGVLAPLAVQALVDRIKPAAYLFTINRRKAEEA